MTAKLFSTSISAPGFMGLNTQDSSIDLSSGYATTATNCVIDKFGRVGARKGWSPAHLESSAVGSNFIEYVDELIEGDGTSHIICGGNNKLFRVSSDPTIVDLIELSYGGGGTAPTITANKWQSCTLNGALWLYQAGHEPLIFDPATPTEYKRISEVPGYLGTVQQSNCVISAYGRTWSANTDADKQTIQFSDLLSGQVFFSGTSGTLDISKVWPTGGDTIVALEAHNDFLYIFGRKQILIYQGATDPATMKLYDVVSGIGCVARDSVHTTGTDIIFLSDSGVRSLQRTIQEKSAPMRDLSANVRDELVANVDLATASDINAVYSDKDAFYLLSIPSRDVVYCFDMRGTLQNGANRVTTWEGLVPKAMKYTSTKKIYFGLEGYLGIYGSYNDNTASYQLSYATNYFDMEQPTTYKILKKIGITTIGGANYYVNIKYSFDFSDIYRYSQFLLRGKAPSEYAIAEYAIDEYGGSIFNTKMLNLGGKGKAIQLGFDVTIDGESLSLQKLDVYVTMGKSG